MKFKIVFKSSFIFFLVFVMLFHTVSPALAALQALPVPQAPYNLRDRFDTDLFTGSATYSYDIKVPKGTDDLTPNVALSYNSSGVRDFNQRTGIGWQLNQDFIERDVNYTPGSTSDDKFKLHFKGGVYDLVYVASDGRYHTKIESNLNIQKLTTSGTNDYGEYWQVITTDGTKYRFGQASNSELACNGRSYAASWNLDQVTDVHDNKIYYTYTESNGASYVSQIKYNNDQSRIIDFTYATSPYTRQVYIQGCNVTESSRLSTIQVKINTNLVRQYDLAYTTAGNSQSHQSITEKGSDGSTLPPTTFEYKPEVKSWSTQPANWITDGDLDYTTLDRSDVTMADVNGDGLVDIIRTRQNGAFSHWDVLFNQGNSWSTNFVRWGDNIPEAYGIDSNVMRLIDVTGDGLPDIVRGDSGNWKVWRNTGTSWSRDWEVFANFSTSDVSLNNNRSTIMDVTGDGLADVVHTWWNGNIQWEVFKNTGNGSWNTSAEVWSFGGSVHGLDASDVRLMDVTGDGLGDIVQTSYSGSNDSSTDTWKVFKNTGSSWNTSPETWINNAPISAHLESTYTTLIDANGDGLPDIVRSDDLGAGDKWKVLLNQGNSWSTTYETWIDPSSNVDIDVHNSNTKMADVDGDGLPDIVKGYTSGAQGRVTWKVWKNNGNAPDLLSKVKTSQGGTISFDYKPSTIYDNTGADTISDLPFPLWVVEKMTTNNGLTNAHGTNDITTYTYADGFYKWQEKEFRGFANVNTTEPNGAKKKYVFKQDDAMKGRLDELQQRDSSSNPYAETDNTWSSSTTNGVSTVKLDSEQFITYDATTSGAKTNQNDYTYDSYGNVTKKSEKRRYEYHQR